MLKVWNYNNALDYIYDSSKIEVLDGLVKLKILLPFDIYCCYHLNETSGIIVNDTSIYGRNGTTINNPLWISGKLNNCLSFNGSNNFVNCGLIAGFERTDIFSVEAWIKTSKTAAQCIISKMMWNSPYTGWRILTAAGKVYFNLYGVTGVLQVHSNLIISDNLFHHIVVTYDGSSLATGVKIYIDSILQSLSVDNNNLTGSILNTTTCSIGCRDYNGGERFLGLIDELVVYTKILSSGDIINRYNSGTGTEYFSGQGYSIEKPSIQSLILFHAEDMDSINYFLETLGEGNQGLIKYTLSNDGLVWRYWNGVNWVIGGNETNNNTIAEIETYIGTFPLTNDFTFRAYLISNGNQKIELNDNTLDYSAALPPLVNAGIDKVCSDNQTIAPFSDAIISDPDGDIENARVYYNIETSGWTEIIKGVLTLQNTIREFAYEFDNPGIVPCQLKIIDEDNAEGVDSCNVTVAKYLVTFNIKDEQGFHLPLLIVDFGDGSALQYLNSPFSYVYDYGIYPVTIEKYSYGILHISLSPQITPIVDAVIKTTASKVWDELLIDHTVVDSFGKEVQNIKTETDKIQSEIVDNKDAYKADVSLLALETTVAKETTLIDKASQSSVNAIKSDTESIISTLSTLIVNIWTYGTRTLTSFGTLIVDIWGYVSRTITSGGITANEIWTYITRTLTSGTKDSEIDAIKSKTDLINWIDITAIKNKTDTIDWMDIDSIITANGEIITKTDTINWLDISVIKTKTDTILWSDIIAIKSEDDLIKLETDKIQSQIIDKKDEFKADVSNLALDSTVAKETTLNTKASQAGVDLIKVETDKIKYVLGLNQENYRVTSFTYDGELLTTATIKIYSTKNDCIADTNALAIYNMVATYNVSGKSTGYRVTKE
jgi:hypothetical protein